MDDIQFRDLFKILTDINNKLSIIAEDVQMRQEEDELWDDFENTWEGEEDDDGDEWEDDDRD